MVHVERDRLVRGLMVPREIGGMHRSARSAVMAILPRRVADDVMDSAKRVAGRIAIAALVCFGALGVASAQQPPVHFWHPAGLPPGAIGGQQLLRGGPLPDFFQPVEITTPPGVMISLAEEGRFSVPQPAPLRVGLLVGQVYRLCAFNLPFQPGVEVFPTIEVIDRLYAPRGLETRFPVHVDIPREDLEMAAQGKFVTRVVYVENPGAALPAQGTATEQSWFDVTPGMDPLAVADTLGRPIAIVRLGGRVPDHNVGPDMSFLFGCPPVLKLPPRPAVPAPQAPPKEQVQPDNSPAEAAPTAPPAKSRSEGAPR